MRTVMYRVGVHRTARRADGTRPRLAGRLAAGGERAAVPEEEARREPLGPKPCGTCAEPPAEGWASVRRGGLRSARSDNHGSGSSHDRMNVGRSWRYGPG
ncbi:hypothetical protein GCM10010363_38230 [Streptomyces omiyaensis]|nr:hypothetical protein GCM10010363_38230 [Streptomyces omiyaensis]